VRILTTINSNTNNGKPVRPTVIFGATGMLGSMFVRALPEALFFSGAQADLTKKGAVEKILETYHPGVVINCAAYTDVDGAEEHEDVANKVNGEGVRALAAAAKKIGARLVHFSTDYIFDGQNAHGYAEDAQPKPLNAYGRSKLAGEQAVQEETDNYLLIRTAWLYGPNGKNFVDTMRKKMESGEALRVVGDQEGSPTYTSDLVDATLLLLAKAAPSGIYHLVNSGRVSWFGFAQKIQALLGTHAPLEEVFSDAFPRPAQRPQYSVLNNTKLKNIKINPLPEWEDALARYLTKVVGGRL
jgi:dTDP-4-dehydrorhamnose reductase